MVAYGTLSLDAMFTGYYDILRVSRNLWVVATAVVPRYDYERD